MASVGALVGAPTQASACSPAECQAWTSLKIAHSSPIPADGVIVLAAEFGSEWDDPTETDLAAIYVEVSGEGGELINGVLNLNDSPLAIIWRPDEPLMPGLTYDIVASVDNTIFGAQSCAEDFLSVEGSVETTETGIPETEMPPFTVDEELYSALDFLLDELVCCDGALPSMDSCGSVEGSWGEGHCASMSESWRVKLAMTLDAEVMDSYGGQIGVDGWAAGDLVRTVSFGGDDCVQTSAVNFATGEIVSGDEVCVSPASAAELGPKPVDPSAELETECLGEPYTCEVDNESWVEDNCEPWPATGDSDSETSTDAGTGSTGDSESSGTSGETTTDSGGATSLTDTATATTDASSDDDSAGDTVSNEDGESGGCACDVAKGPPAGLAWLALALPVFWRRRRSGE